MDTLYYSLHEHVENQLRTFFFFLLVTLVTFENDRIFFFVSTILKIFWENIRMRGTNSISCPGRETPTLRPCQPQRWPVFHRWHHIENIIKALWFPHTWQQAKQKIRGFSSLHLKSWLTHPANCNVLTINGQYLGCPRFILLSSCWLFLCQFQSRILMHRN